MVRLVHTIITKESSPSYLGELGLEDEYIFVQDDCKQEVAGQKEGHDYIQCSFTYMLLQGTGLSERSERRANIIGLLWDKNFF
jgi:hypothetical protein